jgi:hypothetical protein
MRYLSRSLWSAAALVAVAGGVGAYAYFGTYRAGLEEQRLKLESIKFFSVDPNEVEGGEVLAKGGLVRFGRSPHGWMIQQPIETRADRYAIQQLLVETLLATSEATVELEVTPESLAKYGLDPPQVRVALDLRDGHRAELRVGHKNEFDGRYYAQNPVLPTLGLVDARVLKGTEKDLYALRDKRLLTFDREQVSALSVQRDAQVLYRLEKRPDQSWLTRAQTEAVADPFEVGRLLDGVRDLRAKAFVDDSGSQDPALLARYGLANPTLRAVLEVGTAPPVILRLGTVKDADGVPKWYGMVEGGHPIGEVDEAFSRSLDRDPLELHDRRVLDLDPARVAQLRVVTPSETFEIKQGQTEANEAVWTVAGDPPARAPSHRINAMLYALATLKANKVDTHDPGPAELNRAGLSTPSMAITAIDAAGGPIATLLIGRLSPSDSKARLVMGQGSKKVVTVTAADLEALPKTRAELLADAP